MSLRVRSLEMGSRGMTLIELIIAVTVVGILAAALGFSFQGWARGYNVESQIKRMHMDLMNARARAMHNKRINFVDFPAATQYNVYDDTNTAPDGNGVLETGADTVVSQTNLDARYPVTWSNGTTVQFNANGLSNNNNTICSTAAVAADYDCINITTTRINMGQLNGGACNAASCAER
ncbi:MAG: type II secretion system protein [Nitrospiraceae bacterium]|nr:MAG: type II secretion system protein [Nitrospiraceae bacterium]